MKIIPGHKWLLIDIILNNGGSIHFMKHPEAEDIWVYCTTGHDLNGSTYSVMNANQVRELIAEGNLIPELSDKEFAMQLALGTVKHRTYNCK